MSTKLILVQYKSSMVGTSFGVILRHLLQSEDDEQVVTTVRKIVKISDSCILGKTLR